MTSQLDAGYLRAQLALRDRAFTETGPDEFLEIVQAVHGYVLSDEAGAGQFRRSAVYFGGQGQHRLEGAPFESIESELFALWKETVERPTSSIEVFSQTYAIFLEKFFRIHPFTDGNGRVARLLVWWAAQASGYFFDLGHQRLTGKQRRKYLKALEYAHRYASTSDHPDARRVANPYYLVMQWIQSRLQTPSAEEAEPPVDEDGNER